MSHSSEQFLNHIKDVHQSKRVKKEATKQDEVFCYECKKVFNSYSNLQSHQRRVHTYDPQTCEFCSIPLKNKDNLGMHVRTQHLNKEKAVCRDCGKEFKCRSYLATHRQAVHDASGIRFFERRQIFRAKI